MSKTSKKAPILNSSLSELIEKFSQDDVIAVMEKEYQSAPNKLIPVSLIQDNGFLSEVLIPEKSIEMIAEGLRDKGFYNPLIVREKEGTYELLLGRKRFLGAKKAGLVSVPCVVVEIEKEEELLMLLADIRDQRDSNVVAMAKVCSALQEQFGYTQKTLADLSHQSRSQITNILRILTLPPLALKKISLGELTYGHARAIAALNEDEIQTALSQILENHLSVRETEQMVKTIYQYEEDPYEIGLRNRYGANVRNHSKSVTFSFDSKEEKEAFLASLLSER